MKKNIIFLIVIGLFSMSAVASTSCEQHPPQGPQEAAYYLQQYFSEEQFKAQFEGHAPHSESKVKLLVAINFLTKYAHHEKTFLVEELEQYTGVTIEEMDYHMKLHLFFAKTKLSNPGQSSRPYLVYSALHGKLEQDLHRQWVSQIECK